MINRVYFSEVKDKLEIKNNNTKPTRSQAFRFGNYQARQEIKEYAFLMRDLGKDLKREHGFCTALGNLFDISILGTFGSIDALISSYARFIHGVAAAVLHPALLIKKDPIISPKEEKAVKEQKESQPQKSQTKKTISEEEFKEVNRLLDETLKSLQIEPVSPKTNQKNDLMKELEGRLSS